MVQGCYSQYENPYRHIELEMRNTGKSISKKTIASDTQIGGDHYTQLEIQPIHYSERNNLTPMEHTAIKYITRHRFKNGKQDIEKAIHTLQLILEEYYTCK